MSGNRIIMCILALCVCIGLPAISATIVLKNGKTIQGTILENTGKTIKVDFNGIPLTYYREEIDSIDGVGFNALPLNQGAVQTSPVSKQAVTSIAAQGSGKWASWYAGVNSYMLAMQGISMKGNAVFMQLRQDFEAAHEKKDAAQASQIIKRMKAQMAIIINEVSALQVPEELKTYHAKQLAVFGQIDAAIDKFMTNDAIALASTMRTVTVAMIDACQEIKRVYVQHEAPGDFIAAVDMVIAQMNAALEKLDTGIEKFSRKPKQP